MQRQVDMSLIKEQVIIHSRRTSPKTCSRICEMNDWKTSASINDKQFFLFSRKWGFFPLSKSFITLYFVGASEKTIITFYFNSDSSIAATVQW